MNTGSNCFGLIYFMGLKDHSQVGFKLHVSDAGSDGSTNSDTTPATIRSHEWKASVQRNMSSKLRRVKMIQLTLVSICMIHDQLVDK